MRVDIALIDLRLRRRALLSYWWGWRCMRWSSWCCTRSSKATRASINSPRTRRRVAALFGATGSLTSPSGWLDANIYENFLPLIMLLITVGYGASCIAGQDEDGTLSLATILPISRRAVVLQKVGALSRAGDPARDHNHGVRPHRKTVRSRLPTHASRRIESWRRAPRCRLRTVRPRRRVDHREPRDRTRRHRDAGCRLVSGELTCAGDRMDSPSSVRFALLLVSRKPAACQRSQPRVRWGADPRWDPLDADRGCRIPPARPALIRSRQARKRRGAHARESEKASLWRRGVGRMELIVPRC